jgi:hypothetical protein
VGGSALDAISRFLERSVRKGPYWGSQVIDDCRFI